jgi:bacterioferritin-associated ferredoxin
MYVCICNALTETHVREAAQQSGGRVASVYETCGVEPCCGKCASSMRDILRGSATTDRVAAE